MKKILVAIALLAALMSCVNVNEKLGGDFIATNMKYDFHSATFDLNDIWMKPSDSLSAYSSRRINFGAIRDDTFGLFRRGCESCPTLCDPMDCNRPGSSVLDCLLDFAQIHVH